ncbi:MAG: AAA family ATPase, partial [Promethearchaeota archaeon]
MISNPSYVGPLALFDPLYVPPELLYRRKEEESLSSILKDALSDSYGMNILYQGFKGIGKKALILKSINTHFNDCYRITIDCKEKTIEELMFSLISSLSTELHLGLNINNLIDSKISHLWNLFKFLSQKPEKNLIFIFNNSEYLETSVQRKLLNFAKNSKITIVSTISRLLHTSTIETLSYYDLKRKLKYYSYPQLLNIFKQRVTLSFNHSVDKDLLEFMTDLILENYAPVPGVGISILRELYPSLKENKSVKYSLITEACSYHIDPDNNIDEFNLLNYLSEENMLTILFLDNLTT